MIMTGLAPMGWMHVVSASVALVAMPPILLWPKGRSVHRMAGLVYVFAMLTANISALMIYHLTGRFGLFHAFALLSLLYTLMGLAMVLARPRNWLMRHAQWMCWSCLSLLAASLNEMAIRLPLHVNTPSRILTVGACLGIGVLAAGMALQPRLKRSVQAYRV